MIKRIGKSIAVIVAFECAMLGILMVMRIFVQARMIPSTSMQPTLVVDDRIVIESVSQWSGKLVERGAIIVFYPPAIVMGGKDLSWDTLPLLGRLTGLPIFPYEPAFIKRIIGLPGDRIRIERDRGVFVNDKLLSEPYVAELPNYSLSTLGEMVESALSAKPRPYPNSDEAIIVPKGMLFVLGDDRNRSEDSHCWGFLDQNRIIGRAWMMFRPELNYIREPYWVRPASDQVQGAPSD